jgi:hypothetical protein
MRPQTSEHVSHENQETNFNPKIGKAHPIGCPDLPVLDVFANDPYIDPSLSYAAAAAFTGFGLKFFYEALKQKSLSIKENILGMSRRRFLQVIGTASAIAAVSSMFPKKIFEALSKLESTTLARGFQNTRTFGEFWITSKLAIETYYKREKEDDLLDVSYEKSRNLGPSATIHNFKLNSDMLPRGLPNRSLCLYEIKEGELLPESPQIDQELSVRPDIVFERSPNTVMTTQFNASSPASLCMAETVTSKQLDNLSPIEQQTIYGSSSLYIGLGLSPDSMVWQHAQNRLEEPNSFFPELSYRKDDDSHLGLGFLKDGRMRLVSQRELEQIVTEKRLSPDLKSLALNQFCFDPSSGEGVGQDFTWGGEYHRNCSLVLQTKSGKQMIMSGPSEILFRNTDYLSVIKQVENELITRGLLSRGDEFVIACCLDVGLAGGFLVRDNGKIIKPTETNQTGSDRNVSPSILHTGSIYLSHIK